MFPIIGIVVVLGSVIAGFLLEKGHLMVLFQPAEVLIICGAAGGTILIANPVGKLKAILRAVMGALAPSKYGKGYYIATLCSLFAVMQAARKGGLASLDKHVEEPDASDLFKNFPDGKKCDKHAQHFVCDTLRIALMGGVSPFDLDQVMERDMEVHEAEAHHPVAALTSVSDSLPGLGIVAAVLGVVVTMGALGGPPEEIGHKVAAALVGTFLGILLCYGILGPITARIGGEIEEKAHFYRVLRVATITFLKGAAPVIAIDFARRVIPDAVRPNFGEVVEACRGAKDSAPSEQAA